MTNFITTENSVDLLINDIYEHSISNPDTLPERIKEKIALRPELTIDFLDLLQGWQLPINDKRTNILFNLLDEGLCVIRYSTDRQDAKGVALQVKIQEYLSNHLNRLPLELRMRVNQIVFDSKLPIELEVNEDDFTGNMVEQADITPRLPELLEQLRREKVFRNAFELYELLLPQIQLEPAAAQIALIAELAYSKKAVAHEVAVLMLLHPKVIIRKQVATLLYKLSDKNTFTPIDLRRLIIIRNWVPIEERGSIDRLIKHLRKNNLSPAPYGLSKVSSLVGSSMDGAGVVCIMMEAKKAGQRQAAGFLMKLGVGIREPWVLNKAPKNYIENILEEQSKSSGSLLSKSVSKKYVNKIVQHFLSVSIKSGVLPEPQFIQIAEIFGADNWQPQELLYSAEVEQLREKYATSLKDELITESLKRSGRWSSSNNLIHSWFETGDIASNAIIEATKEHEIDQSPSLEAITTNCLMKKCLEKWKMIFLITCLWMRTKNMDERGFDLMVILHNIDQDVSPSEIPLLCNIAGQTVASAYRREIAR